MRELFRVQGENIRNIFNYTQIEELFHVFFPEPFNIKPGLGGEMAERPDPLSLTERVEASGNRLTLGFVQRMPADRAVVRAS